jgi:hypothetical protein
MCNHTYVKVYELIVCTKCGMTLLSNGKVFFDRKLPNYKRKKKGKGKKK